MFRNCSKVNTVKSSRNRPLGVSNFAIDLGDNDGTYVLTLADTTEALPLGMMEFDIIDSDDFDNLPSLVSILDSGEESSDESVEESDDGHIHYNKPHFVPEEDPFEVGNPYLNRTNPYCQIGNSVSCKLMHILEQLGPYISQG